MNRVKERCSKDSCAKFSFASKRMFLDLKIIKIGLYLINTIPVIFCFIEQDDRIKILCSVISFALTLVNEFLSNFLTDYKERAILLHQLYEASITGSTFSKIEYDRESTNDVNELAIRRGLPKMRKAKSYPVSNVPNEITDDYSYLYLCRMSAATTRYLLGRLFVVHALFLIIVALTYAFVLSMPNVMGSAQALYYLICFWPLLVPFIRNCLACRKCQRQCVKICADIDNFFADGDASVERLARFYYYVQNLEFDMMVTRPIIYKIVAKLCSRGTSILNAGVTERFKEAIGELKNKALIAQGVISTPKSKSIITDDTDYSLESLEEKLEAEKLKKERAKKRAQAEKQKALEAEKEVVPVRKKATDSNKKVDTKVTEAEPKKTTKKSDDTKAKKASDESKTTKKTTTKSTTKK